MLYRTSRYHVAFLPPCSTDLSLSPRYLVLPSSSLTSLHLLKIPATDRHVPLVLVHAASEVLHIHRTRTTCSLLLGLLSRISLLLLGVVESRIHRLCISVLTLALGVTLLLFGILLGSRATTTAEPAAEGVADGRSDCDTGGGGGHLSEEAG